MTLSRQRGASSVLILVMLVAFVILITSSVQFIAQQSTRTVDQEQEEQAFGLSDAGVSYTRWLLNPLPTGGGFTPEELLANPPPGAVNHPVYDENSVLVGFFSVEFLEADDALGYIRIRTTGIDKLKQNLCQVIEAELESFGDGNGYETTSWDHQAGYPCNTQIGGCTPYPITLGQTISAELTTEDCDDQYVSGVNSKADLYTWNNTTGAQTVQINLIPDLGSFAPYLTFRDPNGGDITFAPDGGGGWLIPTAWAGTDQCDATGACIAQDGNGVAVVLTGLYQIEVAWNGQGSPSLGTYTLEFVDPDDVPTPECSDGVDNGDVDSLTDVNDPGCHTDSDASNPLSYDPLDTSELGTTQCDDDIDNDSDTNTDVNDVDCTDPSDNTEAPVTECNDGVDNGDVDSLADTNDPGCHTDSDASNPLSYDPLDTSELGTTQCDDGLDNDSDLSTDVNDSDCTDPADTTEAPPVECSDGVDNSDIDSLADTNDPGCHTDSNASNPASYDPNDTSELGTTECDDGIDNDGDFAIDINDVDCAGDPAGTSEGGAAQL